jgi:16S rRNA (cytosine1402-N4)-methyltransferase
MTLPVHMPVMLRQTVEVFPEGLGGAFYDGTGGAAGMARAILERSSRELTYLFNDLDGEALVRARAVLQDFSEQVRYVQGNYGRVLDGLAEHGVAQLHGSLLDLGLSSDLLVAERGFSFEERHAVLDMRMDTTQGPTARDVLTVMTPKDIEGMLEAHADLTRSRKLAEALHQAAIRGTLLTVGDLLDVVRAENPTAGRKFMARLFQALRIQVNDELGALERFLAAMPRCLAPGGRVAVLSYHSIEDRIVKRTFRAWVDSGLFRWGTKRAVVPTDDEIQSNSRARSARLRFVEKV